MPRSLQVRLPLLSRSLMLMAEALLLIIPCTGNY